MRSYLLYKESEEWKPLENITWTELDKNLLKGVGSNEIMFRKEISPKISNLLGWVLTDGSISVHTNTISVYQSNLAVLEKLKEFIIEEYRLKSQNVQINEIKGKQGFQPTKNGYVLTISNKALKYIFIEYYGFSLGKNKKKTLPKSITKLPNVEKCAFLTGCLEGDGNIYFLENKKARLMITCKYRTLVMELYQLFESLGYENFHVIFHKKKNCYILETGHSETIAKLIVDFYPFMIHPLKLENIYSILKSDKFTQKLRVKLPKDYKKKLILSATESMQGNGRMDKYKNLASFLSKYVNFNLTEGTLRCSWKYLLSSIPLGAFIALCSLTNENYSKILPEWLKKFLTLQESIKIKSYPN